MKSKRFVYPSIAALTGIGLALTAQAQVTWTGPVFGDWSVGANWLGGAVPSGTAAEVTNSTAVVSSTVPAVTEAWAGNSGVAGNIIVTNGGVLTVNNWLVAARTGNGGNTPLSTITVAGNGVIKKAGDGFVIGDGTSGRGVVTVRDSGQILVTGGYNQVGIGWGAYGEGWIYLQDNALFSTPAYDFNVADWGDARGHAYIKDNARLEASRFWVGKWDNTVGALWQTGGAVVGTGTAANEWCLGGEGSGSPNAFGFYQLAGGTLTCPFNFQVGRYGKGIFYQSGGTNTQSGWCDTARYTGSRGITWISGGLFQHIDPSTRYMVGESGRGEVTLSGTGVLETTAPLMMANGVAYLTLKGGTLRVPEIGKWSGQAYLNLDGGTIQAKADNASFMIGNLTEARVYPGNAIFDTAGYNITVAQSLLAGSGDGILSIPITDGGAGYMAPPIVTVDSDGIGALALAQIDPVAGKLTNIIVTCPGYNYSSAATASLLGGGPSQAATLGTPTLTSIISGGVIKKGAGTLTLTGANNYSGTTVVEAGTLVVTPAASGFGAYTVANDAGLGVLLQNGSQLIVSSLVIGGSTGARLNFDLGNTGNPVTAPLYVSGALTVNGTVTINIADALPQVGQFPLVQFASKTGTGSFVLGSLPNGVQATLVTTSSSVELKIESVGLPRWDGQAGGTWDINLTTNWIELSTGLAAKYADGAPALFDDNALGTTTVNLVTNVQPANVTVTNVALNYTLTGTGKLFGSMGLTKQGAGSLTIANALNEYTGRTVVAGGTLDITNLANGGVASAIGKSTAASSNLVLSGGTLVYSGPPAATDRGYSVQAASSGIDTEGDLAFGGTVSFALNSSFIKRGPAKLSYTTAGGNELSGGLYNIVAGSVFFNGSAGAQINHNQGELWVGGGVDSGASLVLSNTTLNVDSWLAIGRGNGSIGNLSTVTLYDSRLRSGNSSMGYDGGLSGNQASSVMALNGTSTYTNNGDYNLGESGGSFASMLVKDTSKVYSVGRLFVGWHSSATGAVTLANSSYLGVNAWLSLGHEGGSGSMLLKDNSVLWVLRDFNVTDVDTGEATVTIQDNAQIAANQIYVGKGVGSTGYLRQTGGTVTARGDGEFQIGVHGTGTYDQLGGVVNSDHNWTSVGRWEDGVGVLNISGGVFNHNDVNKIVQVGEVGNGTLNLSGSGLLNARGDRLQIAGATNSVGMVNLNGGTLATRRVAAGSGSSTFNFNGGLLLAAPTAQADFMSGLGTASILSGGARIDSGTNLITISQALGGSGGLTKLGTGALRLDGINTYTGLTVVSNGTLGGNGTISGPVAVRADATLSPGASVGVLTVNNTLTLQGTTLMEINKSLATNDLVTGVSTLTYGGTLVLKNLSGSLAVGDTFKLFAAATYSGTFPSVLSETPGQTVTWDTSKLAVDGTVKVATAVMTPIKLTPVVSGGNFTLAWPVEQIGWRLEYQVNPAKAGISTNWVTMPGSTLTNQVSLPIDTTAGSSFFRLVFP